MNRSVTNTTHGDTMKTTSPETQQVSKSKKNHCKLSAIMFTDIKGFSRRMGQSETLTLKLLRDHNRIMRFLARKHRGRIVKGTGDGYLLDFSSAVHAVECAMEAQERFARYNTTKPESDKIIVRIGVSLGEVRIIEGDLFGDEVNIAARLQALAVPGGVCVTREVYERVKSKLSIVAVNLGPQELKNICRQIEVYQLLVRKLGDAAIEISASDQPQNSAQHATALATETESTHTAPLFDSAALMAGASTNGEQPRRPQKGQSLRLWAFAAILPALLLLPSAFEQIKPMMNGSQFSRTVQAGLIGIEKNHSSLSQKTIAITFFENRTQAPSDEWLCVGLADMLITDLKLGNHLQVLGRPALQQALDTLGNESGNSMSLSLASQTAKQMQADFMLFGWIIRSGNSLRIDVQLFDSEKDELLMVEKVQGESIIAMVEQLSTKLNKKLTNIALAS